MLRLIARFVPQNWRNRLRARQLRTTAAWRNRHLADTEKRRESFDFRSDCRLCRTPRAHHRVIGRVPLTQNGPFIQRDYRLVHCHLCDTVYLDPLPAHADLKTLYEDSIQFSDAAYSDHSARQRILRTYGRRVDHLGLLPKSGEAILEVGAGLAWMSRICKQRNSKIRIVAQDVSAECATQCPWVDQYQVGGIESIPPAEQFSLVSMTHVIEHLADPREMLEQIRMRTRADGHVFITAPFRPPLRRPGDGLEPWLTYSYLHVPAHISYLSERWFRKFAAQHGFDLLRWDNSHDAYQAFEVLLRKR